VRFRAPLRVSRVPGAEGIITEIERMKIAQVNLPITQHQVLKVDVSKEIF
jgi:hypothetical protein